MRDSWEKRIDRALELAGRDAAARPLLDAYRRLLILQRDCHASLRAHPEPLTGSLERDLIALRVHVPHILKDVVATGPPRLAEEARQIIAAGNQAIDVLLLTGWHTTSDELVLPGSSCSRTPTVSSPSAFVPRIAICRT